MAEAKGSVMLRDDIVHKFGVSYAEADEMIGEAEGRVSIRQAVAAGQRGEQVKADPSPQIELQRRKFAVGVLKQGVVALTALRDHIDEMIKAEKQLIGQKLQDVTSRKGDWWDMRGSGWSAGGREHFAHCLCDVLNNLDESTLSKSVRGRMGFNRTIVIPEQLQERPTVAPAEASADSRQIAFEAAMMRVGRDPGVQVMADGPAWKFRFTHVPVTGAAGAIAEVRLRGSELTVAALNSPHGREPRQYRVPPKIENIAALVRAAVKEMF